MAINAADSINRKIADLWLLFVTFRELYAILR
jgi:hypothetical protein